MKTRIYKAGSIIRATNRLRKTKIMVILMFLSIMYNNIHATDFILINKIMYDTPLNEQIATGQPYSNGEYVELYNAGVDTVNLTGWVLRGGGSTEIYNFPVNTSMSPKSFLIVAYQYNNSNFTLDQLYADLFPSQNKQILYQRKIILSNSGEQIYLRNNLGTTKDSIYYDGTSNKTKPNRLSAENADGTTGNSCVCIQRKTALYTNVGSCIPNNVEWTTAIVNPFQLNVLFIPPMLPGVGVSFAYDLAGNRITRKLVTINSNISHIKREDSSRYPQIIEEKMGNLLVTVYPNPTQGNLAVKISGAELPENTTITVYNSEGKTMLNFNMPEDVTNFNISSFPSGWYILRVITGNKHTEFKIIKQ